MVVVHTAVTVETGCILSAGVILNHNSVVHEGCHIGEDTVDTTTADKPQDTLKKKQAKQSKPSKK